VPSPVKLPHRNISQYLRTTGQQLRLLGQGIARDRAACVTAALFILFSLPTCLLLAMLVPPGEVADEPAHLVRADSLLYGEILGQRRAITYDGKTVIEAGLLGDPNLFSTDLPAPIAHFAEKKVTPAKIAALERVSWSNGPPVWLWYPTTAVYLPIFYLPAAAEIGLAHVIHLSPYHAILGARIVNSLCFVAIGVCTLLLARSGRILLFCVLSLPMTVSLAASLNQDGLFIAVSALAFALLTRAAGPRGRVYWAAAILIAALVMVKLPYFPLALLLLVPCIRRPPFRAALLGGARVAALAVVPGVIWAAITMHFVATPYPLVPPYHPGYLWPGNHNAEFQSPNATAQAEVFLHRPLYTIILPIKTIGVQWVGLRNEMVGMFGWMEFGIPGRMYRFWVFAIACAILSDLLRERGNTHSPPPVAIAIGLVAIAAALCAVFDAEYLVWSRVGAPIIEGVQGRYLLPLLAAFAVSIPAVRIRGAAKLKTVLAIPSFAMAAAGLIVLPSLMVSVYYLR
jgi:uncharacterized membrane protein